MQRGGRRLGILYAVLSLLLVLALLPALHPPRPPLPPVAAFAPVAQQNPTKPPPNQASIAGKGANQNGNGEAAGGSGATPTPAPTPTPTPPQNGVTDPGKGPVVPRYLDCVNGPGGPRQIEDTQSPPCIPYWKGDNGGHTWSGVDANTIRIGVDHGQQQQQEPDWVKFFNDRFQLYGRHVEMVPVHCGSGSSNPQATMVGDAREVAAQENVFAVIACADAGGQEKYFYDELARKGILSVAERPDLRTEADYQATAPYEWNYIPGYDTNERNLAAQACAMQSAPAPSYTASATGSRTYGVLYSKYQNTASSIDLHVLLDGLGACGIHVSSRDVLPMDYVSGDDSAGQQRNQQTTQQAQQAALTMSGDHVTTVFCISHASDTIQLLQAAEATNWHPEWLMGTFMYNTEWNADGPLSPTDQWDHALGLDYHNKLVPAQDNPWYWAVSETDPSYGWPYAPLSYYAGKYEYPNLLLLFAGLQIAGPHLTPQTFQQGLWNTHFPNPPSPYYEGTVGFSGDHTFVKDRAAVSYSAESSGPWGQSGVWCYVGHGQRFTDATLPKGSPYFASPCDS